MHTHTLTITNTTWTKFHKYINGHMFINAHHAPWLRGFVKFITPSTHPFCMLASFIFCIGAKIQTHYLKNKILNLRFSVNCGTMTYRHYTNTNIQTHDTQFNLSGRQRLDWSLNWSAKAITLCGTRTSTTLCSGTDNLNQHHILFG